MRNGIIIGVLVLGLGALWFVLTQPSSDEPEPGGLSSHQVEEEQPFDPYLDDTETATPDQEPDSRSAGERAAAEDNQQDGPTTAGREEVRDGSEVESAPSEGESQAPGDLDETAPGAVAPAEARQIADAYLNGAATNPDRNLELYAERVNYYDQGTVSRSEVLRDKRQYLERWPERNYERTSDVEIVDAGAADLIRFNYQYRVSGGSRNAEGTGWAELGVQRREGRVQIVSERGGVTDRE